MYHVSAQGVDERIINVCYYYGASGDEADPTQWHRIPSGIGQMKPKPSSVLPHF